MKVNQNRSRQLEAAAWGALLIWWGFTELVQSLPAGSGALGIGIILLGLNAARYHQGIRISAFSTSIGVLSFLWGGLELAKPVFHMPVELPVVPLLLIVFGILVMLGDRIENQNQYSGEVK